MSKQSVLNVFKDGDMFCATLPTFVDLQESLAGFGKTVIEAKFKLMLALYNELRPTKEDASTGNSGSCGDCEGRAKWNHKMSDIYIEILESDRPG